MRRGGESSARSLGEDDVDGRCTSSPPQRLGEQPRRVSWQRPPARSWWLPSGGHAPASASTAPIGTVARSQDRSGAHLLIASSTGGSGRMGDSPPAQHGRGSEGDQGGSGGPCRSRRERLVSGEPGPDRPWASLRATSTPATLDPRWVPSRARLVLVVVAVDPMAGGVGGGLGQRPAQPGRTVGGERATVVAAAGPLHPGHRPVEPHSRFW
jgi:hypothetical protein